MDDLSKAYSILTANNDKNFVRRILNPEAFPTLELGKGNYATHLMSWGDLPNGKYAVFPRVQYSEGELKDYGKDAFRRAIEKNDYIQFDNPQDAEWFSQNYKTVWQNRDAKQGLIKTLMEGE